MPKYRRKLRRPRLCSYPGCRAVATSGRCQQHSFANTATEAQKASKAFLNSAEWKRLRDQKLAETPWCEHCQQEQPQPVPATQVDHILPRHSHPQLALVYSNLQSLCDRHHAIKTRRGQ